MENVLQKAVSFWRITTKSQTSGCKSSPAIVSVSCTTLPCLTQQGSLAAKVDSLEVIQNFLSSLYHPYPSTPVGILIATTSFSSSFQPGKYSLSCMLGCPQERHNIPFFQDGFLHPRVCNRDKVRAAFSLWPSHSLYRNIIRIYTKWTQ